MLDTAIDILLIEDETAHAELIQRAFSDQGNRARVHHMQSLTQARAFLAGQAPHLIIADWRLPDGESLELLSNSDNHRSAPVIFMTSYGNERIAVEALKSGAIDYVVKSPESMLDMPHIAERALEQSRTRAERVSMQKALSENEAQFRLLAENSSDMISRHDTHSNFLYVSPASRVILGYEPEELVGKRALDYVHPDDLAKILAMVNLGARPNSIYTVSYQAQRKDQQTVWLETSARAIFDAASGEVVEIHAASRDITKRKRYEEALQTAHHDLEKAYDETIEGWIRALDLRDRETEGHTQRVTEMTIRVSRVLGLPESEIVHIRRGALLHDIGKIAIPDEITKKTGPLNEKEWEIMRKHPEYAYNLISPIAYLRPALDIPYSHHERWDGSGYPQGLKGEEIPITARMFAIIDVWDALISDRPYRKALPEEEVTQFLRKESGKLFDPRLVELFLRVLKEQRSV